MEGDSGSAATAAKPPSAGTDQQTTNKEAAAGTRPASSSTTTAAAAASSAPPVEDPNKMPEGIQPLFLSTPTCEIFNLRPGTDISAESPLKKLQKSDIMADIQQRRAISDFQPYKEQINVLLWT
jgi:hypothetical protein